MRIHCISFFRSYASFSHAPESHTRHKCAMLLSNPEPLQQMLSPNGKLTSGGIACFTATASCLERRSWSPSLSLWRRNGLPSQQVQPRGRDRRWSWRENLPQSQPRAAAWLTHGQTKVRLLWNGWTVPGGSSEWSCIPVDVFTGDFFARHLEHPFPPCSHKASRVSVHITEAYLF